MQPLRSLTVWPLAAIALAAAVCGCGAAHGSNMQPASRRAQRPTAGFNADPPISGAQETHLGEGAHAALVLSPADGRVASADKPLVVFLHAWGTSGALLYRAWLAHLVGEGATVVFPVYQDRESRPASTVGSIQAGVRAALRRIGGAPASVVLAGYTTGAALAIDYAVAAGSAGLPPACALYGVFPALSFGLHAGVPMSSPSRLPAATSLTLVAGSSDPVPGGEALARTILAEARRIPRDRRKLLRSTGAAGGPLLASPRTLRIYWDPLDRLVARCAGRR